VSITRPTRLQRSRHNSQQLNAAGTSAMEDWSLEVPGDDTDDEFDDVTAAVVVTSWSSSSSFVVGAWRLHARLQSVGVCACTGSYSSQVWCIGSGVETCYTADRTSQVYTLPFGPSYIRHHFHIVQFQVRHFQFRYFQRPR